MEMSERYVSLAEVRDILTAESEKRGGFGNPDDPDVHTQAESIQRAALLHSQAAAKLTKEQADELVAKVSELEFVKETGSPKIAFKIADLLPEYPEEVRAVFSKERISLDQNDIQKVLDIVNEYR